MVFLVSRGRMASVDKMVFIPVFYSKQGIMILLRHLSFPYTAREILAVQLCPCLCEALLNP